MKTLPWFRMYHEAIDDEKLRLLAYEDRWHFVALLCCKAKGILDEGSSALIRRKVAVKLGLAARELDEVSRRLAEVDLIDQDTLQPIAWADRQCQSDKDETNAQRQARYREAHKSPVTGSNALRNGAVTGIEVDVDKEEEGYGETFAKSDDLCPHKSIVDIYHSTLPTARRIQEWTPARQSSLRSRWREKPERQSLEWWTKFFGYIAKSDFLCGRTSQAGRKPFELSLDWICKSANFVKVLEGAYAN